MEREARPGTEAMADKLRPELFEAIAKATVPTLRSTKAFVGAEFVRSVRLGVTADVEVDGETSRLRVECTLDPEADVEAAPTGGMDRSTAVEIMTALGEVEKLLDTCPHGIAKMIKQSLAVVEGAAEDAFPGGYACDCIYCDAPIGHEEAVSLGDEKCCPDCWEKRKAEMAACAHEYQPDHDEHGDPIQQCPKCGHAKYGEDAP